MSYIGKAPGFGIRNRYYFTATAAQTTFSGADDNGQTLAYADSKYLDVYLNGVLLVAGTDYTATTLTSVSLTTGAAASDIVEIVAYDIFSVADTVSAKNGGTFNGNITIDSTGFLGLPAGTTAQRPGSPAAGYIRHNTDNDLVETYDGTAWVAVGEQSPPYSVEYVVVAGGGGGGRSDSNSAGGGGAGGYRSSVVGEPSGGGASAESAITVTPSTSYTVTIGAGGTGPSTNSRGGNGNNSVFSTITSIGGGGGAAQDTNGDGLSGGSGGGASYHADTSARSGGSGTTGQGFRGGNKEITSSAQGCGGGGAGAQGADATGGGNIATNGGAGVSSNITGSSVTRAGGGGGACVGLAGAGGGAGGGGAGSLSGTGTSGTANTGGGGGGASNTSGSGGAGGSGVVIIRYAGLQKGTGGTVTSSGGYTIHTFTSSGTFTA